MKKFHDTPRDLRYLSELEEVQLMPITVAHLRHWMDDLTMKSCLRRHRTYQALNLVQAVTITAAIGPRSQRQHINYLTEDGAAWLAFKTGRPPRRLLKSVPAALTLQHRANVARIILSMNDGALRHGGKPDWHLEHDRFPAARCDLPIPQQYILAEDFAELAAAPDRPVEAYGPPRYDDPNLTLVKVRPDAAGLLPIPGQKAAYAFYVEMDNGTEPLASQFLPTKLPGLHALFSSGTYRRHWPEHKNLLLHPRALWVFTSAARLDNVRQRILRQPTLLWRTPRHYRPSADDSQRARAFLDTYVRFAFLDEIVTTPRLLTTPIWMTVSGTRKVVFRPSPAPDVDTVSFAQGC